MRSVITVTMERADLASIHEYATGHGISVDQAVTALVRRGTDRRPDGSAVSLWVASAFGEEPTGGWLAASSQAWTVKRAAAGLYQNFVDWCTAHSQSAITVTAWGRGMRLHFRKHKTCGLQTYLLPRDPVTSG